MRSWLILEGKAPPVSGVSGQDAISVRSQAAASGLLDRLLMPMTKAPRDFASSAILTESTVEPELEMITCTDPLPVGARRHRGEMRVAQRARHLADPGHLVGKILRRDGRCRDAEAVDRLRRQQFLGGLGDMLPDDELLGLAQRDDGGLDETLDVVGRLGALLAPLVVGKFLGERQLEVLEAGEALVAAEPHDAGFGRSGGLCEFGYALVEGRIGVGENKLCDLGQGGRHVSRGRAEACDQCFCHFLSRAWQLSSEMLGNPGQGAGEHQIA